MDNNEIPLNIYLDLSKAFDTLDHNMTMLNLKWVKYKPECLNDPFLDHCYLLYIVMISKHLLSYLMLLHMQMIPL